MKRGLGVKENVSILIEDGKISKVGKIGGNSKAEIVDVRGCVAMPGLVDAHTHLVYAGTRESEMAMRLSGASYEEIARQGGGIMRTVSATRMATERELLQTAQHRVASLITSGTTTVEIKSGYGLSRKDELKILRVIKRLKETLMLDVVATFLGAHAVPKGTNRKTYVAQIIEEMLPAVARERLADFCDVFMESIAFSRSETEQIFKVAQALGLKLKIHADELTNCGGAVVAGKFHATSADHLIYTDKKGIGWMKKGKVIPVLLPGTALFLKIKKRPNVTAMLKMKMPVALASDFNPGTCMISSMFLIIGLGCFFYNLTLADALQAATINGARAVGLADRLGSIEEGKQADLLILDIKNFEMIPYYFGRNFLRFVIKKGVIIYEQDSGMRSQF